MQKYRLKTIPELHLEFGLGWAKILNWYGGSSPMLGGAYVPAMDTSLGNVDPRMLVPINDDVHATMMEKYAHIVTRQNAGDTTIINKGYEPFCEVDLNPTSNCQLATIKDLAGLLKQHGADKVRSIFINNIVPQTKQLFLFDIDQEERKLIPDSFARMYVEKPYTTHSNRNRIFGILRFIS